MVWFNENDEMLEVFKRLYEVNKINNQTRKRFKSTDKHDLPALLIIYDHKWA